MPRGKWLCSVCHVKTPAKKKAAPKKTPNRDRVSESETASVAEEAPGDATPPASVASPRRAPPAGAKRKDGQASLKDLAPCRYKG